MKKFSLILAAALLAAVFSACADNDGNAEQTSAVTGVPEPLITSLTTDYTPEPEPEKKGRSFLLGAYNPFDESQKLDDSDYKELSAAVAEIADACLLLHGRSEYLLSPYAWSYAEGADNSGSFCDMNAPLETSDTEEYSYFPVNPSYAADEEELFIRMRNIFTGNYISDDEIRHDLFDFYENDMSGTPAYKTIDGRLCVRSQYLGVPVKIHSDEIVNISYYDGKTAKLVVNGYDVAEPMWHVFMTLKKSDEHGWQLDEMDMKNYWAFEAKMIYNAFTLRQEKLNAILGGGNLSDDDIITVKNKEYARTDLDMTVEEMRDFFEKTFRGDSYTRDSLNFESYSAASLREPYIRKYITGVYYEQDGALYRKKDAPVWYLPELKLDPYHGMGGSGSIGAGSSSDNYVVAKQTFYDSERDELIGRPVTAVFNIIGGSYDDDIQVRYIYIASELPIREKGERPAETPAEAVDKYLNEMRRSDDDIEYISDIRVSIPQAAGNLADKYLDAGEDTVFMARVYYVIEYTSASGMDSQPFYEWFAIGSGPFGMYVLDRFHYDPHTFTGTVTELLDDDAFIIEPDEDCPERDAGESFIITGIHGIPYTLPEKAGDRMEIVYNGQIYYDEAGVPQLDVISAHKRN